jgi:hypothetical protein
MRQLTIVFISALLVACEHSWFRSGAGGPENQQPEITTESGYVPGTPLWVPLIDDCMARGGARSECIESLPPEVLEDFEAAEREVAARRRALMRNRNGEPAFGVR